MHHGVTFNISPAKMCSAIFETCFSHNKDICIAATYDYIVVASFTEIKTGYRGFEMKGNPVFILYA